MGVLPRSESKSSYSERMDNNSELFVEILFVTMDKLSSNTRKRFENQVSTCTLFFTLVFAGLLNFSFIGNKDGL